MSQVRSAVYREDCPACGSANYYDAGDPDDLTGVDVEGLRCWSCSHEWLTEGSEEFTSIEDANIEDGKAAMEQL